MSHVAKIGLVVKDLDILEQACKNLGLELVRGQKTHKWFGTWVNDYSREDAAYHHGIDPKDYGKCEHAIRIPGNAHAYEIGVVKNKKGEGWLLVYDFWSGGHGMSAYVDGAGKGTKQGACGKLVAQYAREAFKAEAKAQGQNFIEKFDEQGNLTIETEDMVSQY